MAVATSTAARVAGAASVLRADERRLVGAAGLVFALASGGAAMSAAAADAMFLAELGPAHLGGAVAASSALLAIVLAVVGGLADRLERRSVLASLALTSAVVIAGLAALSLVMPRATAAITLIGGKQLAAATDLAFWVVIAERLDARRSRIVLPMLAATGGVGAALGAVLVIPIAGPLGARGILGCAALLLALAGAGATRLSATRRMAAPPARLRGLITRSWRDGARAVHRQPLARHIAVVVAAAGAFASLAYFALGVAVAGRGSAGDLAALLGAVRGVGQLITLAVQLVVAPRLLDRLGTGRALLLAPLVALAAGLGLVIAPILAVAIATQVSARVLDSGIETPAEKLAQTLLPGAVRGRIAGFLDGTAKRAGAVLGGLLAAALAGAPTTFYAATAVAAVVWLLAASRIARELPALAIAHVVHEADPDAVVDDRAVAVLVRELAGPRPERAAEVLARLHGRGRMDVVTPLVDAATTRGGVALWRALIAVLDAPASRHGPALAAAVAVAPPSERALAIRALGLAGGVAPEMLAAWRDEPPELPAGRRDEAREHGAPWDDLAPEVLAASRHAAHAPGASSRDQAPAHSPARRDPAVALTVELRASSHSPARRDPSLALAGELGAPEPPPARRDPAVALPGEHGAPSQSPARRDPAVALPDELGATSHSPARRDPAVALPGEHGAPSQPPARRDPSLASSQSPARRDPAVALPGEHGAPSQPPARRDPSLASSQSPARRDPAVALPDELGAPSQSPARRDPSLASSHSPARRDPAVALPGELGAPSHPPARRDPSLASSHSPARRDPAVALPGEQGAPSQSPARRDPSLALPGELGAPSQPPARHDPARRDPTVALPGEPGELGAPLHSPARRDPAVALTAERGAPPHSPARRDPAPHDPALGLTAEIACLRLAGDDEGVLAALADAGRGEGVTARLALEELALEIARALAADRMPRALEAARPLVRALRRGKGDPASRAGGFAALARVVAQIREQRSAELSLLRAELLELARDRVETGASPIAPAHMLTSLMRVPGEGREDGGPETAAALGLYGGLLDGADVVEADDLRRIARALGEPDDAVRAAAEVALRALGPAATGELIAAAAWGRRRARDRAAALLAEQPVTAAAIDQLIDAELDALDRSHAAIAALPGDELLARRLAERLGEIAHTVLLLLAARRRSPAIARAAVAWRHARGGLERARTLAVIEAALPRALVGRLVDAVDDLTPGDRAAALARAGRSPPSRDAAIRAELAGGDRLARALALHTLGAAGRSAHRETIARAARAESIALAPHDLVRKLSLAVDRAPQPTADEGDPEMPTRVETLIALGRVPLLAALTTRQLADVAERARWTSVRQGVIVVTAGDAIDALIVVEDGELVHGDRVIGKGEVVDELACVAPVLAAADLRVLRAARLIRLERIDFEELVDDVPGLAAAVCRALGERARRAEDAAYRSPLVSRA